MNVPKLRFNEFNDDYTKSKLNQFAKKISNKNKNCTVTNVISNSAQFGLISQRDFFDKDIANDSNISGYYIIENGDFVYNPRKSKEAPYGPINQYKYNNSGVISPLYLCFKVDNISKNYLEYYFKSSAWHRYIYMNGDSGARHDRVSIKDDIFFNLPMWLPSIKEQEKISRTLELLDKKIELQSKKIEDLKLFKKGLIDTLINNITDYKTVELGKIGNTYSGLTGKTKEDFENGNCKFIPFTSVLNNKINIDSLPTVLINNNESQNMVEERDLFFNTSSETKDEVALCTTLNEKIDNLYLNSFCFGFRIKDLNIVDNNYLNILLHSTNYRKKISVLGQGFTRINISKNKLMELNISIPNMVEQLKISKMISLEENKIKYEIDKLDKLNELKKGLMQNLFV